MNPLFIYVTHHYPKLSKAPLCFSSALVCLYFYLKCFAFVVFFIALLFLES
jgi:hypothetical protein